MSDQELKRAGGGGTSHLWFVALGLLLGIVLGILLGIFVYPSAQPPSSSAPDILTPEEAGEKAIVFIRSYAVPSGVEVTLVNITEMETGTLYKGVVNLSFAGETETRDFYITGEGKLLFLSGIELSKFTIGNFLVSGNPVCTEDGKVIVYFFGNDNCGFCKWEHPLIVNLTSKFDGYISFHDNMNNGDRDSEIFATYSPDGSIPTIVLGCTYYRVGAGVTIGADQEEKVLTALICALTQKKPEEVCSNPEIVALITQIE
ncbi:MAG: thioredoxin family protein [Methanophagales archaeon ANME-1-THS]|nr:MAG: thioredoxin family protein [Methanophagales archaeon ANME-1-THS]